MPIAIDLTVEAGDWPSEESMQSLVADVIAAAAGRLGVAGANTELSILLTDNAAMRHLNAQWRGSTKIDFGEREAENIWNILLQHAENIDNADVFCGLTNSEEANILSSMLSKRLGAHKVMALINRASYVDLVESGSIDIAISPQQVTIGSLLAHVRRGDVVKVHSLRRGAAEAIEAIAHGSESESKVVGRAIEDIALPTGAAIVALARGNKVIIAHHDTVIETDDHVILFLTETDEKHIRALEKLFQPSALLV